MNLSFTLLFIINLKFIAPKLLKNIETSKKTFQHPNLYITNCNYFQTKKHCPALAGAEQCSTSHHLFSRAVTGTW